MCSSPAAKEDFEALNIRQVEAALTYGDPSDGLPLEQQSLLFRDSTGDKTYAVKRRGRKSLAYTCALTYAFAHTQATNSDTFEYKIPPAARTGRSLLINPYEDFGVLDVDVAAGQYHPDIRQVDIMLAYQAPDQKFTANEHFRMVVTDPTDLARKRHWQVRTLQAVSSHYTVASTFTFLDGSVYQAPPLTMKDSLLRVDAPFHNRRTRCCIRPNVISPQIDNQITVEIEYKDPENNYARQFAVNLTAPFQSQESNGRSSILTDRPSGIGSLHTARLSERKRLGTDHGPVDYRGSRGKPRGCNSDPARGRDAGKRRFGCGGDQPSGGR